MRNFEKLMLTVVAVALLCDLVACVNTENGTSLRGRANPRRNLSYLKSDKKRKYGKGIKKYSKILKGYKGIGLFGDDDGGGKGAKKYNYIKNYKHDTMSDNSNTDSTFEDDGTVGENTTIETNPANETTESRIAESPVKEQNQPVNEPTDSSIEDPTQSPVEEFTQPTDEPTKSIIEDPTQSPIEEPTQSRTEEPIDSIENETDNENEDDLIEITNKPLEPDFSSRIQRSRTVQIKHPGANECMTYDYTLDNMAVFMKDCSTMNSRNDDYWEILQITTANGDLVHIRHKSTQLCIPINPESPKRHFNCFQYFGMNEAVADSFTGLVDCSSDFVAAFEIGSSRSLHMSNSGCEEATSTDQGVVFMTYNQAELTDDVRVVVWGGQNLLEMENVVEEYNFSSEWSFVDV